MTEAQAFERCISGGGVALFPSDTVYGLACDLSNPDAVKRLYALKRRDSGKPSAVMMFSMRAALSCLPPLGERTRAAFARLLPGGVTLLLPNPDRRFPLACGEDGVLGLRVPDVPMLAAVRCPVLQSSANLAGGPDPRSLEEVPPEIRSGVDLTIDGGELPGTPSTIVDLSRYEEDGSWLMVRQGAVDEAQLREALGSEVHFHPSTYEREIRHDIPDYDILQRQLLKATGQGAQRILELGTGTGLTTRLLLERHPEATLVGVDESEAMLEAAREALPAERVALRAAQLQDPLPEGPFDLVASALTIHHLGASEKAMLFTRLRHSLVDEGRVAIADVVSPGDPAAARIPLTPGFDMPSSVADQLEWLAVAGFEPRLAWEKGDLAVMVGVAR